MYDIGIKGVKELKELDKCALSVLFPLLLFPIVCLLACKNTKNICKSAIFYQLLPFLAAFLASFAVRKHIISSLDLE